MELTDHDKELLPCPFCGGTDLKLFGEYAPEWWVCCETCKAATQTRTNKSQAIEDWNRRATLQSQDRDDDPLQPAANWLFKEIVECKVADIRWGLRIGHNRAQWLSRYV